MLSDGVQKYAVRTDFFIVLKEQLKQFILLENSERDLNAWFDPLLFSRPDDGSLLVKFPHQLFFEWFSINFQPMFEKKIRDFFGGECKIVYSCNGNGSALKADASQLPATLTKNNPFPSPKLSSLEDRDSLKKSSSSGLYSGARPPRWAVEFSFENFLFNRKNQLPVGAAKKFASGQGPSPFIMFAPTACGKTHLLYAICSELLRTVPKNMIFIGTLSELETIGGNIDNTQRILKFFSEVKYFLIDNFQDCAGSPPIQRLLLALLEQGQRLDAQFAFCLDCPPAKWDFLDKKLRSSLENGLLIEIKKPDLEIKSLYARKECQSHGLSLKNEDFLTLSGLYSDFRQIHGAILKILAFQTISPEDGPKKSGADGKGSLDLDKILKHARVEEEHNLTPEIILQTIAEYTGLEPEAIKGTGRSRQLVKARHILSYLCRDLIALPFSVIGSFIGKDHSSVLYSYNKIKKIRVSDNEVNNLVTELSKLCVKGAGKNPPVRKQGGMKP
ncbi:hypothetical protein LJC36_03145 [Desulfovibrio sp. OttesenSCG-928-C14]|nr:hypothetical protein [Desulfovibrio sp. OttesenSCG-928-C14]